MKRKGKPYFSNAKGWFRNISIWIPFSQKTPEKITGSFAHHSYFILKISAHVNSDKMCIDVYGISDWIITKDSKIYSNKMKAECESSVKPKVFIVTHVLFILVKPQEIVETNNGRIIRVNCKMFCEKLQKV